ncbi:hypothetical protein P152DRAFT_501265 [Eremomyces bilateralis CBS 781.70]|uniref:Uncharacterized protein n=1 Tax=Eremomyces bilateralis CBS 781.70 TaxID=1392243 RepID=A0A6G1G6U9_9PEZI|nr:uncharacterized protein P152DRAFT_501265 [Eremomyces bilateralis CBS 781.70]KAF1813754.1 hypothetical protein P152DRAFT_501265 [Eremomyces bilateralis CBS 781.70]
MWGKALEKGNQMMENFPKPVEELDQFCWPPNPVTGEEKRSQSQNVEIADLSQWGWVMEEYPSWFIDVGEMDENFDGLGIDVYIPDGNEAGEAAYFGWYAGETTQIGGLDLGLRTTIWSVQRARCKHPTTSRQGRSTCERSPVPQPRHRRKKARTITHTRRSDSCPIHSISRGLWWANKLPPTDKLGTDWYGPSKSTPRTRSVPKSPASARACSENMRPIHCGRARYLVSPTRQRGGDASEDCYVLRMAF